VKGRLNLASQRFGNERLPVLGFSLLCAALLAITVQHALAIRQLLPSRSSALHKEVTSLQEEAARLRKESAELRAGPRPEKARIEEWQLVKDLVDRRVFRWTQLFACLADSLPDAVRLTSVTPNVSSGTVSLEVEAVVKSMDAGLAFIQQLEQRPEFHDVYPEGVGSPRPGEEEFHYVMLYLPEAARKPAPAGAGAGAGQ
jgi:Tfp pilus assembly protein PilN